MSRLLVVSTLVVLTVATALPVGSVPLSKATASQTNGAALTGDATQETEDSDLPRIVAVYPNPVTDGDAGEFVVIAVPEGTDLGKLTLGDDEASVELPNRTASGRVVLSTAPNTTRGLVEGPVFELPDRLALANSGETVTLAMGGRTLDSMAYDRAPDGELRVREQRRDSRWRPLGATDRPVVSAGPGTVTAFVLPDGAGVPTQTLGSADRRILLGGYTLTDGAIADELVAAARRNVTVRVLVDANPVGGMTTRQATLLDRLTEAGVEVRVSGGERARYRFHHAKYAVVDDQAVVTTENWKRAGVGGNGSRGWGVVTDQHRIVTGLVTTFRADAGGHDALAWGSYRSGREFERFTPANETYPTRFPPRQVGVDRTRLLVAPDNAERTILGVVDNASTSIAVQQVSLGSRHQPFVQATLEAARRGVRVRILLSSAWYVEDDNQKLVAWLNEVAEREGLPLEAQMADPRGRYEKIHAKGVVVDGDTVVLGSLNWNNNSARENREVVLVLEGEEIGTYYERVFEADWHGGDRRLPAGVAIVVVLACLVAAGRGRCIRFDD